MPHDIGSTRPSTALAAMAASIALPPSWRTRIAVAVASGWLVAAMPCLAMTAERVLWIGPEGRSAASEGCTGHESDEEDAMSGETAGMGISSWRDSPARTRIPAQSAMN